MEIKILLSLIGYILAIVGSLILLVGGLVAYIHRQHVADCKDLFRKNDHEHERIFNRLEKRI